MRESLKALLDKTLIRKYRLPDHKDGIGSVNISTLEDDVFLCSCEDSLAEIIYNSIVEYSHNEFELNTQDFHALLAVALRTKIKYKNWQTQETKIKYGFYGEVLLYSILYHFYHSKPLISRGYFYNPLENSETKGYDSYHLVEDEGNVALWFGEVKFRATLASCAKSAIEGLDKAFSDAYLVDNILAMDNHRNNFSVKGSKIEKILHSWRENPKINIIDEVIKHDMKLIYPVLLVYPDNSNDFKAKISNTIAYINKHYSKKSYSLAVKHELFFILIPLSQVKKIKEDVISWIESSRPLLS
ncbi:DUF1837 domain-containing protein [Pseudoalteromonas sp. SIMBA_153]